MIVLGVSLIRRNSFLLGRSRRRKKLCQADRRAFRSGVETARSNTPMMDRALLPPYPTATSLFTPTFLAEATIDAQASSEQGHAGRQALGPGGAFGLAGGEDLLARDGLGLAVPVDDSASCRRRRYGRGRSARRRRRSRTCRWRNGRARSSWPALPVSEPPSNSQSKREAGALVFAEGADGARAPRVVARALRRQRTVEQGGIVGELPVGADQRARRQFLAASAGDGDLALGDQRGREVEHDGRRALARNADAERRRREPPLQRRRTARP